MATRAGGQLKELIEVRGRPVIDASLAQLRRANVTRAITIIAEHKLELARVLGDGAQHGVALAYVMRAPRGLADALAAARPHLPDDASCCLVLPDTLIEPADALARVCAALPDHDLVLGVFPTDRPAELGPVRIADGRVVEVLDKPAATELRTTWGIAAWSPRFTELLCADPTPVLGAIFQRAIERGLRVGAVTFADGAFFDVGTPAGLAAAIASSSADRGA